MAVFVVAAVVLSLNGVCICAHPHALPPHACGGGCRRRAYLVAIFVRRFRGLFGAFVSSFAQALERGSCVCILLLARALSSL
jgi:hypothetical protein